MTPAQRTNCTARVAVYDNTELRGAQFFGLILSLVVLLITMVT